MHLLSPRTAAFYNEHSNLTSAEKRVKKVVRPKPTRSAASHKPITILKSPRFRFLPTSVERRHCKQDFAQFAAINGFRVT